MRWSLAVVLCLLASPTAWANNPQEGQEPGPAQEPEAAQPALVQKAERIYIETFDGDDTAVMLNGVVDYGFKEGWFARVEGQAFRLSNEEARNAVRHYSTPTVSYPGSGEIARTDGATIEVDVRVSAQGRSGAGLIAGFDSRRSDYLLFAVGPAKQVYVISRRTQGRAKMLIATTSDAVRQGETNRLRVAREGAGLVFEVNGTRIVKIDREEIPGHGIGIGAFGQGDFSFDNVRISDNGPLPTGAAAVRNDKSCVISDGSGIRLLPSHICHPQQIPRPAEIEPE
jgi:hypothetical protein